MRSALIVLVVLASLVSRAATDPARLRLSSEPPGARVYLDTLLAGETPLLIDSLQGTVTLRIVSPDSASWLASVRLDTIVMSRDTAVHYRLQSRYYLNTIPSGAEVFWGDSLAGITPLVFTDSLIGRASRLELRKSGYQAASIGPGEFSRGSLIMPLELSPGETAQQKAMALSVSSSSHLHLHLSGYSTLLFGLMTAYLKSRADQANQDYLRTEDPAYMARRNRLDQQAAISIIATEISLGFFIYFLLLE